MDRWRGGARLAIAAALLAGLAIGLPAFATLWSSPEPSVAGGWRLVVRDGDGQVVIRASLPDDRFALRYRNSLYGTLAEERFAVGDEGQLRLVELAADQAALLDEYYVVGAPPTRSDPGDPRRWRAPPATELSLEELALAATEQGQRTLVIAGRQPIALWPLTEADPTLILAAEPAR